MELLSYIDEIKLLLTGGILELEIDDATIAKLINASLREIQRYIETTKYETVDFSNCIDLSPRKINTVARVYRANGIATGDSTTTDYSTVQDPLYILLYLVLSGNGSLYNFQNYAYNLAAWNTALLTKNTLSTDLNFMYDHEQNKLYINASSGTPQKITIEYVPRFENVEDIKSDFWIDILMKLSVANTKVALGRIRTRFTLSSSLWNQDGEKMLSEGLSEISQLREKLETNTLLTYTMD